MGKISDIIREGCSIPEQKHRQLLTLDEQFSALESQVKILQAEKLNLQAQVNPLQRQVDSLQQRVKAQDNSAIHNNLEEIAEKLLLAIASSNEGRPKEGVIMQFELTTAKGNYYFSDLMERAFIRQANYRDNTYKATPDGLSYLNKKGLL